MVMVNSGITQYVLSKSNVDPCGVCSLSVKAKSVLCLQCGKWIHSICAGVKRVTPKLCRNFAFCKSEGNHISCGRVSAGGGCEADVTARTRCLLVKLKFSCCMDGDFL